MIAIAAMPVNFVSVIRRTPAEALSVSPRTAICAASWAIMARQRARDTIRLEDRDRQYQQPWQELAIFGKARRIGSAWQGSAWPARLEPFDASLIIRPSAGARHQVAAVAGADVSGSTRCGAIRQLLRLQRLSGARRLHGGADPYWPRQKASRRQKLVALAAIGTAGNLRRELVWRQHGLREAVAQ